MFNHKKTALLLAAWLVYLSARCLLHLRHTNLASPFKGGLILVAINNKTHITHIFNYPWVLYKDMLGGSSDIDHNLNGSFCLVSVPVFTIPLRPQFILGSNKSPVTALHTAPLLAAISVKFISIGLF